MRKPNKKMLTGGTVVKTRSGDLYMVFPVFTTPKESRAGWFNHEMVNGKVLIGLTSFGWTSLESYTNDLMEEFRSLDSFDIVEVYQPTCQAAIGSLMEQLSFGNTSMDDMLVMPGREKEGVGYIKVAERKEKNNEE